MEERSEVEEIWGTWAELILAYAVSRHGTDRWDSVAMEVGRRTPSPHLPTAQSCRRRFRDLQRRFDGKDRTIDGGGGGDEEVADGGEHPAAAVVPWLEELRSLRVAELRREVERHDVSIVSLQLKVKRLKEEREQRDGDDDDGGARRPDLDERRDRRDDEAAVSPVGTPSAVLANGDRRSGRSCNESNSETPAEGGKISEDNEVDGRGPDLASAGDEKGVGEGSCNGSSDSIVKREGLGGPTLADGGMEGDAVAVPQTESTGRESSDVQSSAGGSRGRRRWRWGGGRRKAASGESSRCGDDREGDEVSPAASGGSAARSQPLASFLEIIRSSKYGSVFERRLHSQEGTPYRCLIRQHMDLETVGRKIEEGSCTSLEFFRDLLLICSNAIVFFPKSSDEYVSAIQLRGLVCKEMAASEEKSNPSPPKASPTPPQPHQPTLPKPKLESTALVQEKRRAIPPLVACRKRSSVSAKVAAAVVGAVKEEKEEKPELEEEVTAETKMSTKLIARGPRTTKTCGLAIKKPSAVPKVYSNPEPGLFNGAPEVLEARKKSNDDNDTAAAAVSVSSVPVAKRKGQGDLEDANAAVSASPVPVAKKRGAANFLKRMKRSSSSPNKKMPQEAFKDLDVEQKKVVKGDGKRDHGLRSAPAKQMEQQDPPVRRKLGRPPKRPRSTPSSPPPGKRPRVAKAEVDSLPVRQRGSTNRRGRRRVGT